MDKAQLMKGILEGCILKIIDQEETYGYEIVTRLQDYGFSDAKEGTLYPLLLRLEKKKLIKGTFRKSFRAEAEVLRTDSGGKGLCRSVLSGMAGSERVC